MLLAQPGGGYHFLPNTQAIAVPFSAAVVADAGFEIVHVYLERPVPYKDGFQIAERHLAGNGRPRQSLCSVELRCAAPYSLEGFQSFNQRYAEILDQWGLIENGVGRATRTNIAPDLNPPTEQVMFGFAYAAPSESSHQTWVLSGAFEEPGLRPGDVSPEGLRAKVADVVETLTQRLAAAGLTWDGATDIGLYTTHDLAAPLRSDLFARIPAAALNGIRWYPSRVPVLGYELEIDVRKIHRDLRIVTASP